MGDMVGGLFGGNKSEMRAMKREQEKQRAELEAEKDRLARAEEGRSKLRSSRRGLLAFLDDDPSTTTTMGGDAETGSDWTTRKRRVGAAA